LLGEQLQAPIRQVFGKLPTALQQLEYVTVPPETMQLFSSITFTATEVV